MMRLNISNDEHFPELLKELEEFYNRTIKVCDGDCLKCFGGDKNPLRLEPTKNEDVYCIFDAIAVVKRAYEKANKNQRKK